MNVLMQRLWLLLLFVLLPLTAPAMEVSPASGDGPVTLEADRLTYDGADGTYRASGNVRLRRGEVTLEGDEVTWNAETGEATAAGAVRVTEPAGELTATEGSYNLQTGLGRLRQGRIFLREQNFHLTGDLIEKTGEQSFRVTGGSFTTCDGERPPWKFGAGRLDVTAGRYAGARNVVFYIKDVPVLYSPYLIYPVKTERESGFLMPRYGFSENRGFELSLAWYQVIARNQDATFYLDYLSDLGLGKGVEYRYIFGEENAGEAQLYHITSFEGSDDRYALQWRHLGQLPGEVRLTADAEYVSSRDYFQDFGEVAGEYNKDQVQSVLVAARHWDKLNLTGQLKYIKDLERDNAQTLQRLPEVNLHQVHRWIGDTPYLFGFDGSATHFWRQDGVKGGRLNLRPSLSAVYRPGKVFSIIPELAYRERLYTTSHEGPGEEREGTFEFSTRVSTRVHRDFRPAWRDVARVRHSVEPELVYVYVPDEDQQELPFFDALDNLGPRNTVALALTNRLVVRYEPAGAEPYRHELLYFRLAEEYDIRKSLSDPLDSSDRQEGFSNLRAELIVRPSRWSIIDLDTRYDPEEGRLFNLNLSGSIDDGGGNAFTLEYRYRRDEQDYLAVTAGLAWLKPVYLGYEQRYDFDAGQSLEKVLNIEYRARCWSVLLTLRDRLEDTEYLVSFVLGGLGRVAKFGGSLGRGGESQ